MMNTSYSLMSLVHTPKCVITFVLRYAAQANIIVTKHVSILKCELGINKR